MASPVLTTLGTVICPHGGQAVLSAGQDKAEAEGGKLILVSDEPSIAGCAFTLPSGTPQPCIKVKWQVGAARATVNGTAVVTQSSVGLCLAAGDIPQGPATIAVAAARTFAT